MLTQILIWATFWTGLAFCFFFVFRFFRKSRSTKLFFGVNVLAMLSYLLYFFYVLFFDSHGGNGGVALLYILLVPAFHLALLSIVGLFFLD
jgi:hypothetical protein